MEDVLHRILDVLYNLRYVKHKNCNSFVASLVVLFPGTSSWMVKSFLLRTSVVPQKQAHIAYADIVCDQ